MKAGTYPNIDRDHWILARFQQWAALHPDSPFRGFVREMAIESQATAGKGRLRHGLTMAALRYIVQRQQQHQ
jgi:hypothetical protein